MDTIDIALRLGAALSVGGALGLNRHLHNQPTGLRTLSLVGLGSALVLAHRVDAYAFGEETAATLGVDPDRTTTAVLGATALLSGAAVALAGLVGFVGLVIPHALRFVIGATHRRLVPASFLAGAAALVLADLGSRTLIAPAELPVGAITGLVGAPFFLALLVRSRRIVV